MLTEEYLIKHCRETTRNEAANFQFTPNRSNCLVILQAGRIHIIQSVEQRRRFIYPGSDLSSLRYFVVSKSDLEISE